MKDWDAKKMRFRRSFDGWLSANELLDSLETRLLVSFRGLVSEGIEPTPELLRASLLPVAPTTKDLFTSDFIRFIEEKRPLIRESSLKNYQTVLTRLLRYESENGKIVVYDADFHKRFVSFQTSLGLHPNTIAKANSCIKAYLLSRGKVFPVKFKKEVETERIFLSVAELELIRCCVLPEYLTKVRDAFVFCCFTGLRYSDLRGLRPSQIKERASYSVIELIPEKSRSVVGSVKHIEVPLLGSAVEILERYSGGFSSLPVLSNQKMNQHLKTIAETAGIKDKVQIVEYKNGFPVVRFVPKYELVTTHVARHTFATLSLIKGVPLEILQKVLGHSDLNTTMRYAKIVDDYKNAVILGAWSDSGG